MLEVCSAVLKPQTHTDEHGPINEWGCVFISFRSVVVGVSFVLVFASLSFS
jgi:hypothetical protein